MIRCKKCGKRAERGFTYCKPCRRARRAAKRLYRTRHPECWRDERRRHKRKRRQARAAARPKAKRPTAAQRWQEQHPDRKRAMHLLDRDLRRGRLKKPGRCQCCRQPKRPIVAYGLEIVKHEGEDRARVKAWVCWKDFHRLRSGEITWKRRPSKAKA